MSRGFIHVLLSLCLVVWVGACESDSAPGSSDVVADDDTAGGGESVDESCLSASAWYQENSEGQALESGTTEENGYGVYDMLGNAVEWVSDCYHETYDGAPEDGSSWDEDECEYRITRGGCYGSTARAIRVSAREGVAANFYGACAPGVRCVRDLDAEDGDTLGLTWVTIPAGQLTMGCSDGDDKCYDNEYPVHTVDIASFQINAYEVTQREYFDQTGEAPASYYCEACAVSHVIWQDAHDFCESLGARLPTEAEWEWAARGGTDTRYPCSGE